MKGLNKPKVKSTTFALILMCGLIAASFITFAPLYAQIQAQKQKEIQTTVVLQQSLITQILQPVSLIKDKRARQKALQTAQQNIAKEWQTFHHLHPLYKLYLIEIDSKHPQGLLVQSTEPAPLPLTASPFKQAVAQALTQPPARALPSNETQKPRKFYSAALLNGHWVLIIQPPKASLIDSLYNQIRYIAFSITVIFLIGWLFIALLSRKHSNKLTHHNQRYQQFMNSSLDWNWEIDAYGNITYSSQQCLTLFGFQPAEMIGKPIFHYLHPSTRLQHEKRLLNHLSHKMPFSKVKIHFNTHDNKLIIMQLSAQPTLNKQQKVTGFIGLGRNVTEQQNHQNTMVNMAFFDALTQLPNRAHLVEHLDAHLREQILRKDLTLSALIFIDLDGFKEVRVMTTWAIRSAIKYYKPLPNG